MRCRWARWAAVVLLSVPCGAGCRLGGGSGMASWLPSRGSSLGEGEELASAPPFEGEIVKPSAQATPYPTTSTPQGYVVPEANEATPPALVSTSQPPADAAVATRTPPITYGMKPTEVAAISGATGAAEAIAPGAVNVPAADTIAAQEGPYAALGGSGAAATATPPADTVVAGFSAAGGTSAGAYPPEQAVGIAPPASETVSMPAAPAGYGSQPTTPTAAPSALATSPAAAAGSSFAAADPAPPTGGSAFGAMAAPQAAPPTASAFGQQAAVPQGSAADSSVAGSRYAAATASRFGGPLPPPAAPAEPAAQFSALSAAEMSAAEAAPQAAFGGRAAEANGSTFDAPGGVGDGGLATPDAFGVTTPPQQPEDGGRPKRRPDPMYRPAGTSSYRSSEPIFSDEPASHSPVQMATFEEPVAELPQQ